MPKYYHDYMHCSQDKCPRKDQCWRYWLGQEFKKHSWQYASFYLPLPIDDDLSDCVYFIDKKEYEY